MLQLLRNENVVNPLDTLSEAMYATRKLDYMLSQNDAPAEPEDESMDEAEQELAPNAGIAVKEGSWKLHKVLAGAHQGWVRSVAVDQVTNGWFVTGLSDAQIKVWDLVSNDVKATILGHILGVRSLAISQKYPYLFSGSEDKTLRCWDLERTNSAAGCQIRNYHGHVGGVYALALHPELDLLFSAGRDSAIRVWDIRSKQQVMVLTGHRGDVTSLVSQIGDPQICSSSTDSTVRLWDIRKQKTHLTLTHHTKSVRLLVMHPEELTMASADSNGVIKQWVLPGGELLHSFGGSQATDSNFINTMSINPATNELFAGFGDGRMHFYDYESGNLVQETQTTPAPGTDISTIYTSAFDMLGMRLITGENDKSVKIWRRE